uniref:Uncharacterized protein n=1 Tax=Panagrolaimus superbus TaxID=310955 RepID=A0A914Y4C5_9BILA
MLQSASIFYIQKQIHSIIKNRQILIDENYRTDISYPIRYYNRDRPYYEKDIMVNVGNLLAVDLRSPEQGNANSHRSALYVIDRGVDELHQEDRINETYRTLANDTTAFSYDASRLGRIANTTIPGTGAPGVWMLRFVGRIPGMLKCGNIDALLLKALGYMEMALTLSVQTRQQWQIVICNIEGIGRSEHPRAYPWTTAHNDPNEPDWFANIMNYQIGSQHVYADAHAMSRALIECLTQISLPCPYFQLVSHD